MASLVIGATAVAETFGGVGAVIAAAFVIATIAAATFCGVACVIVAPHT